MTSVLCVEQATRVLPPPVGRRCVFYQVEDSEHEAPMNRERLGATQQEEEDIRWRQQEAQGRREQQLAEKQRQLELHQGELRHEADLARWVGCWFCILSIGTQAQFCTQVACPVNISTFDLAT